MVVERALEGKGCSNNLSGCPNLALNTPLQTSGGGGASTLNSNKKTTLNANTTLDCDLLLYTIRKQSKT